MTDAVLVPLPALKALIEAAEEFRSDVHSEMVGSAASPNTEVYGPERLTALIDALGVPGLGR